MRLTLLLCVMLQALKQVLPPWSYTHKLRLAEANDVNTAAHLYLVAERALFEGMGRIGLTGHLSFQPGYCSEHGTIRCIEA
ncbi:hypothetical protein BDW22DRAFT_1358859 [Trametopsis cervina]|nr:hypothetical protein BDW22DRAFT_1358859 [Trametopsis cervina]